jgi:hypothetical protein
MLLALKQYPAIALDKLSGGAGAACLTKFVSWDCETIFAVAEEAW